jgi:putative DNA methylase
MCVDTRFNIEFADDIAKLESYNKHLYRPNTYLHKWWARRCGSTFRAILKHLVRDEAYQDYYTPGGLEGTIILDPMMGGGTTVHEAIRLGANVVGTDIDPIPILQARATLSELPLAKIETAFAQFYDALYAELAPLYQTTCPTCALPHEFRFILYGLRRQCHCGGSLGNEALFVDSLTLRHNSDGSIFHIHPESHDIYLDDRLVSASDAASKPPIFEKKVKVCLRCYATYKEDTAVPFYQRYQPIAIVGECKEHGLFFAAPQQADRDSIAHADERRSQLSFSAADFRIETGPKSRDLLNRGIDSYLDLFSSRQLLFLSKTIDKLEPFEPLVRLNLALLVSTSLEFNAMLCGYKGSKKNRPGAIRHTFAHHAYSFPYTALENNPLYRKKQSGNLQNLFYSRIVRGRRWAKEPVERVINGNGRPKKIIISGEVDEGVEVAAFSDLQEGSRRFMLLQGSSAALSIPDNSVDYVITDPPYFDSVQYSDLAAFFRVWLRKLLPDAANWEYSLDDAAVDQHANGNGQYTTVLGAVFTECHRVLKDNGRLVFTFHHWNPKGWAALTKTLHRAGFVLINRYVVHSENPSSVHIANQKSLVHDVVLVLAPNESASKRQWDLPYQVNTEDSQSFCQDCGAVLGWMLDHDLPEDAVDARWLSLLSRTTTQMQLLEKHDA